MRASIFAFALLAACGQQSPENSVAAEAPNAAERAAVSAPAKPSAPAAKAFSVTEENELYKFSYSWSAEAAAIRQLVSEFTKEMEEAKAELVSQAKEGRAERIKEGFDYFPYETQEHHETAGQSDRLLSLQITVYGYTGGAHGSTGSAAMLWDRQLARRVRLPDILQQGQSWNAAIRQPFCVLLDREREKRRQEPVEADDLFGNCPKLDELTTLLSDTDKNGRFDHVTVIADQYVAGPYAEGPYEIALPITAKMIERLKPEYAASFEPKPPVK